MTPTERQRIRRAKLREQGLSSVGRPLAMPKRKRQGLRLQMEKDVRELLLFLGLTNVGCEQMKRDASEYLIKRTSNWRITKI